MPTPRFIIYGLVDPRTALLRYVGRSSYGLARAKEHLKPTARGSIGKKAWVDELRRNGLTPTVVILQVTSTAAELPVAERQWIAFLSGHRGQLLNATPGGGSPTYTHSDVTRARIANAVARRFTDPSEREAASRRMRGVMIETSDGRVFHSIKEAARQTSVPRSSIQFVLRGVYKQAKGLTFKRIRSP